MREKSSGGVVVFGGFELHQAERRLLAGGRALTLGARAYDVLRTLVERRDRVVSREELLDQVWPGLVVEENNLSVQIGTLRRLLGVAAIATIPGRGYQFTVPVDGATGAGNAGLTPPMAASLPARGGGPRLRWNLPTAVTPLLGRESELLQLVRALAENDPAQSNAARLFTVVGAGGVGKTRLAQEALAVRGAAHTHGGCFVDLAPLPPGASVAGTVASALGLDLGHGTPDKVLAAAMAPLNLLLLLDNAEHLLDSVARLCADVLAQAPLVLLLVTSQTPLKVAGEQVIRLEPLTVPSAGAGLVEAAACGAVRLFAERARAADRRFVLTAENIGAVVEVCARIDGLPLALELAAARVQLLGVRGLADALEHRFEVLTLGTRSAPPRQQTLRAALEWSLSLLDEREQRVFRCLGVLAASASLELVQALAGTNASERWLVVEALGSLLDRSLVQATHDDPPRYRMLDTPRSLARQLLVQAGEWNEVSRRHAHALRSIFEVTCRRILVEGCHQSSEMATMELSRDDARTALTWAVQHDRLTAVSLLIGVGLVRSAQGAFTLDAPPALVAEAVSMAELDQLPAPMLAWWAFNYSDYERSDSRLPALGRAWAERALDIAQRQGVAAAADVARAALLAHLPVDEAGSAALAATLENATRDTLPFVRTTAWSALALRYWKLGDNTAAVAALDALAEAMEQQGLATLARVARTSLIAFWLGTDQPDQALRVGRALLAELEGTRNERALADCRRLVMTALLFAAENAQARDLAKLGWLAAGARDERMHPGWLDLLALLAAQEGRLRTATLLLERADRAWGHRRRGRTSVRVRGRVEAALTASAVTSTATWAPVVPVSDAAIERMALATADA